MSGQNKSTFLRRLEPYLDGRADTPFEYFILLVILLNSLSVGLETIPQIKAGYGTLLVAIDTLCLTIFVVELLLKIIVFNKRFFSVSKWNTFDLIIVVISVVSSLSCFTTARIFRIFRSIKIFKSLRIFKTLKFLSGLSHLQTVVKSLLYAIPSILWTFFLLLIIFYVYAVLGVNIFGEEIPEFFGTIPAALYTLFQLMLCDDYGNITRSAFRTHPFAWLYFVSFALISAFVVLQVVTGIIVDSMRMVAVKKDSEDSPLSDADNPNGISRTAQEIDIAALHKQLCEIQNELRAIREAREIDGGRNQFDEIKRTTREDL